MQPQEFHHLLYMKHPNLIIFFRCLIITSHSKHSFLKTCSNWTTDEQLLGNKAISVLWWAWKAWFSSAGPLSRVRREETPQRQQLKNHESYIQWVLGKVVCVYVSSGHLKTHVRGTERGRALHLTLYLKMFLIRFLTVNRHKWDTWECPR